jgi:hypothetical protein
MDKIVAKIKEDQRGYKRVNVPKQKETESWKEGDLIELKKVNIK